MITWPASTLSLFETLIDATVPSCGATISFSIFIASRMQRTEPLETESPTQTLTSRIVPGIGASTLTEPSEP